LAGRAGAPGLIGPLARDVAPAPIRFTVADPNEQTRLTALNALSLLGPEARPAILEVRRTAAGADRHQGAWERAARTIPDLERR
jgi:hypothetical protein